MKIAIIGAQGQLGSDLFQQLPDAIGWGHFEMEITDAECVNSRLDSAGPDVVVNCAAYNLVDQAEDEPEVAFRVNALGPRLLAKWCAENSAMLVHVSTDYVFGQDADRKTPYREADLAGPVGAYGISKLAGEQFVQAVCPRHLIVRTCGLYGHNATRAKGNFVSTMLRLAKERDELRVVNDQHCTPSYTRHVATGIIQLIRGNQSGLYHLTNSGPATWYDVASEAVRIMGLKAKVTPIPSSEYPTKARRPAYSVLDCGKYEQVTGTRMPDWRDALAEFLWESGGSRDER
ncbi:MAG: dTDP-4-dehydrorhamnose reductase [Planctomycetaceae bacterium]|nr:dTDP-4-dehydrorhamnose reductase [Planctomycetaceae bacterium]